VVAVAMNFVNKYTMAVFPLPMVVLIPQMAVTVAIIHPLLLLGFLDFPRFNLAKCRWAAAHLGRSRGAAIAAPPGARARMAFLHCRSGHARRPQPCASTPCRRSARHLRRLRHLRRRRSLFWITILYTGNTAFALYGLITLNIPMYSTLKRLTPMFVLLTKVGGLGVAG
jgi:hypothetical protein